MKKLLTPIKQIAVYIPYYLGIAVSKTYLFEKYGIGFSIYNKLHILSLNLQEMWGLEEPWKEN